MGVSTATDVRMGDLLPEFPGQTHVWMWREINHLRDWGLPIDLYGTRPAPPDEAAKHDWAEAAKAETTYLTAHKAEWPAAVAWAAATRPAKLAAATRRAATIPVEDGRLSAAALVAPACWLARRTFRTGITHWHAQTASKSAILLRLVQLLTGCDYSVTVNNNPDWWGGAMREKLEGAKFVVGVAQWIVDQLKAQHPPLADRVMLARHGVDAQAWTPAEAAARGVGGAGPLRVVSVGRLVPAKGHQELIPAVAAIEGATLTIYGEGPYRPELEKIIADLDVADRVKLPGGVGESAVKAAVRAADVVALASHAEALGVVYMEAMACGKATLGTAAGGVPEFITDGRDGLLVPPEDVAALTAALRELEDADLRERLGTNARRTVVEKLDSRIGAALVFEAITGTAPAAR